MPCCVEKTATWTIAQTPNRTSPARRTSVRGASRVSHRPASSATAANGSSHATWPPTCSLNIRHRPDVPPKDGPPPPPNEPPPPPGPPPPPPRRPAEGRPPASPDRPAPAARPAALGAGQAAEAVVAEDQVPDRAVR